MNDYISYALYFLISYLICTMHPAFFIGKLTGGIDIRQHGSNNSGASNAAVVLGWKFGVLTAVIDILKGVAALHIVKFFAPPLPHMLYVCALGCILGHLYPFYLKFKGGKGLATLLGVCFSIWMPLVFILGAALILITLITQYIALGTLLVSAGFVVYTAIVYHFSVELIISIIIFVLMGYKHLINIKRIMAGEEIKLLSTLKKKDK